MGGNNKTNKAYRAYGAYRIGYAEVWNGEGGEPLRGSFLMGLVTPQFVPAAHHCGVCTVVIAFGDAEGDRGGFEHKCA